ncbi:MAG: dihydroorotate dehydrogenase (quinone), partial [Kiloniellaceae bacterium]
MDAFSLIGPALRLLDPEAAHNLTLRALEHGFAPHPKAADDPALAMRVWGLSFANPIGLAAGFDKDARVMPAMLGLG